MKKQILIVIAALGFTFGLAGVSAQAQTHGKLTANIPFDFYVGDQKLVAGEYTIVSVNPQSDGATLVIRQKDGKGSRILNFMPEVVKGERTDASPSLIFNRYGSEYFLSEVRNPTQTFGARAPKSKVEANLAGRTGTSIPKIVAMNTVKD